MAPCEPWWPGRSGRSPATGGCGAGRKCGEVQRNCSIEVYLPGVGKRIIQSTGPRALDGGRQGCPCCTELERHHRSLISFEKLLSPCWWALGYLCCHRRRHRPGEQCSKDSVPHSSRECAVKDGTPLK